MNDLRWPSGLRAFRPWSGSISSWHSSLRLSNGVTSSVRCEGKTQAPRPLLPGSRRVSRSVQSESDRSDIRAVERSRLLGTAQTSRLDLHRRAPSMWTASTIKSTMKHPAAMHKAYTATRRHRAQISVSAMYADSLMMGGGALRELAVRRPMTLTSREVIARIASPAAAKKTNFISPTNAHLLPKASGGGYPVCLWDFSGGSVAVQVVSPYTDEDRAAARTPGARGSSVNSDQPGSVGREVVAVVVSPAARFLGQPVWQRSRGTTVGRVSNSASGRAGVSRPAS